VVGLRDRGGSPHGGRERDSILPGPPRQPYTGMPAPPWGASGRRRGGATKARRRV